MDAITALRFVRGAVSAKSLLPEMKHYVIEDGRVRSFNGVLALSSPIDLAVTCAPRAEDLYRAIGKCTDVVALGLTKANRLRVQSGKFTAFIECLELEGLPHQVPDGEHVELDGKVIMQAIEKLLPFIGNDASRPWTNGVLLREQSALATNNVCLIEYWLGVKMPFTINIPIQAIKEMVRIKEPPTHAQVTEHSITFHYEDGRWIRTQLFSTEWPDLSGLLNGESTQTPVAAGLFEALEDVRDFVEKTGRVYFKDGYICTHLEDELGARHAVEGLHSEGVYHAEMLRLLSNVAKTADFTRYPKPVLFQGDRLRGAIMGQRA